MIWTPALIATGGTAVAALGMLTDWGLKQSQIKVVSVLGSRQGVQHVSEEFPEVEVCSASPLNLSIYLDRVPHSTFKLMIKSTC